MAFNVGAAIAVMHQMQWQKNWENARSKDTAANSDWNWVFNFEMLMKSWRQFQKDFNWHSKLFWIERGEIASDGLIFPF